MSGAAEAGPRRSSVAEAGPERSGGRGPSGARRLAGPAYRLLALFALRHAGRPLSKGELAWQVRANHPTITRVLKDLHGDGLVAVQPRGDGGYSIAATPEGLRFADQHAGTLRDLFAPQVAEHFRYGPRPAWLPRP